MDGIKLFVFFASFAYLAVQILAQRSQKPAKLMGRNVRKEHFQSVLERIGVLSGLK